MPLLVLQARDLLDQRRELLRKTAAKHLLGRLYVTDDGNEIRVYGLNLSKVTQDKRLETKDAMALLAHVPVENVEIFSIPIDDVSSDLLCEL